MTAKTIKNNKKFKNQAYINKIQYKYNKSAYKYRQEHSLVLLWEKAAIYMDGDGTNT